jgi:hypothetical protein
VTTYPVGIGTGPTRLAWGGGAGVLLQHHSAVAPGPMPPRSVQVFLLEPAP